MKLAKLSIRHKLLFATLTPLTVAILLCWMIGAVLITDRIFHQAQQQVISDLNLARKVYRDEIEHIVTTVKIAGLNSDMCDAVAGSKPVPAEVMQHIMQEEQFSFMNLIDRNGVVKYRTANPDNNGDWLGSDPLVARALKGELIGASQRYSRERLAAENLALAATASIKIKATPMARSAAHKDEQRGLVLVAATPLRKPDGEVIGLLQAGFLLNNNTRVVDTITRIVFEREGNGAATIFLDDVRVSTNVRDAAGERASGTLMSAEVAKVVLDKGESWSDRAFVLSDWFVSAYEPIKDPTGSVIGAIYVGMPEEPLLLLRRNLNLITAAVLFTVACIGITISSWISRRMAKPVRELAKAARGMAAGEHVAPIVVNSGDEIALLANEFNTMAREVSTLKQTLEDKVVSRTLELEEKNQQLLATQKELSKKERLAELGILAAGVAHEINNPLAVIRGNAELLQTEISPDADEREEVDAIVQESIRIGTIVNNLKGFSRSGIQRLNLFSVGKLLDSVIDGIAYQIEIEQYRLTRNYWGKNIEIEADEEQLRQVFGNLLLNAFQAMPDGGELLLDMKLDEAAKNVFVTIKDYGNGIIKADLERLFTPFFTTKSKGTGLGLAVSYGIVTAHGGRIHASSVVGEGALFTVELPLRPAAETVYYQET